MIKGLLFIFAVFLVLMGLLIFAKSRPAGAMSPGPQPAVVMAT